MSDRQRDYRGVGRAAWVGDCIFKDRFASEAWVGRRVCKRAVCIDQQLADFHGRIVWIKDVHWCCWINGRPVDFGHRYGVTIWIAIVADDAAAERSIAESDKVIIGGNRRRVVERRRIGWIRRCSRVANLDRHIG